MRKAQAFSAIFVLGFCSGCASINSHEFNRSCKIYGGVRDDAGAIAHPDVWYYPLLGLVDSPFSFIADSLYLPSDLANQPPSVDPLKGWNSWPPWDEESQPAGSYNKATKIWSETRPPKHPPLDQAIKDDYQKYLDKHEPGYFAYGPTYFEDGTGRHAVKIQVGRNGFYKIYVFMYDKSNMRIKVIKYADGGYAC
jgi:uncharacterized protein YceK